MKSQAIIFDIDGTAIDSPKQKLPTERLVKAIRDIEDRYYLCAATGRVWPFAEPVLKGLELIDPCIISGGTQICNPASGEILWQINLEPADLETALAIIRQYPDYLALFNEYTEEDYLHGGAPPTELEINEPTYILEQKFVPKAVAPEIVAKLSKVEGVAVTLVVAQRPGFNDIHITNKGATKEHAITELLKMLKVDPKNTIGVGDGHNDIHLFNGVARKVAMANAVNELKTAADETIGPVSQDGFAQFLESL